MMLCACCMQLSQIWPEIPAMSTSTSLLLLPQKEHFTTLLSVSAIVFTYQRFEKSDCLGFLSNTSSIMPYSLASPAVIQKSRSLSSLTFSYVCPECSAMMSYSSFFTLMISLAVISMSEAWPWAPPRGWWIMMRECFSAVLLPCAPAHKRTAPMDAAMPVQMVATSGEMYCMVSYTPRPAYTDPPGEFR